MFSDSATFAIFVFVTHLLLHKEARCVSTTGGHFALFRGVAAPVRPFEKMRDAEEHMTMYLSPESAASCQKCTCAHNGCFPSFSYSGLTTL